MRAATAEEPAPGGVRPPAATGVTVRPPGQATGADRFDAEASDADADEADDETTGVTVTPDDVVMATPTAVDVVCSSVGANQSISFQQSIDERPIVFPQIPFLVQPFYQIPPTNQAFKS